MLLVRFVLFVRFVFAYVHLRIGKNFKFQISNFK